jgi:dipeptidyl aminopeptidase/acylaminoacyl peptidase
MPHRRRAPAFLRPAFLRPALLRPSLLQRSLLHPLAALTLLLLSSWSCARPEAAKPVLPAKQYSIEDFVDTTSIGQVSIAPDDSKVLFSSNKTGIWNVYTLPLGGAGNGAGGAREWTPITRSTTDNNFAVAFIPADSAGAGRILITRDQGGNEQNHLYAIDSTGAEKDLTPGADLKAMFVGFNPAGDAFYVATNERDARFFDVYRYDAATYERKRVFQNDGGYEPGAVSNDERWMALAKTRTTNDGDLYVVELGTAKVRHISPHQGDAQFVAQDFDPAGKYLYYTSNEGAEFSRLRRFDLAAGSHDDVQVEPWDVVSSEFSHGGKYRVSAVNVDGSTSIRVVDAASGAAVPLPQLPAGEIRGASVSRSEKLMAFLLNGDRQPNDLYLLEFGKSEPTRLTTSLSAKLDATDLVDSSVVRFAARDGLTIPNILWKPHQASAAHKAPALVWVHGGPGGQTTRSYNAVVQYLANHGYVVLGINNRGSSGYGKTFYAADDRKHGREPLWDCVDAKKYLQSLDYVDADRIGIIGGSYGGYMVLAALAFQPQEFKVGIDIFGVSNWVRTLQSIPPYWESFREALYQEIGDPATQLEFLQETSPAFHGDKIVRPLFVLQGKNDPRVIQAESDDIVAAVKKNGVPVEYIVFDDEGHGFSKKKNQIAGYGAMLKFLDTHLKGETAPR